MSLPAAAFCGSHRSFCIFCSFVSVFMNGDYKKAFVAGVLLGKAVNWKFESLHRNAWACGHLCDRLIPENTFMLMTITIFPDVLT